ncbi:hypothetical protein LWM68_27285 [Niabella sp. W65]|jgi:TFIIF-interacting CTD phosphatase-like protein|nr:hypothetical protein [Niabella sp. W65]MCH7366147.1 hypothetical protein [Niabella sp. W65]ULT41878.1 hypothetical protein KRR40_46215 [Niabella sp. I65]
MKQLFTILFFIAATQLSCAQKNLLHVVKTRNGTTVHLYSDNTWEYANATPSKLSAISYHYGSVSKKAAGNSSRSSNKTKSASTGKPVSGRVYHTGPRGGCYYYTAGGNKVYVDRSYCK